MKPITLITFDVDGTLIRGSGNVHAKAFLHAAGIIAKNQTDFENLHDSPLDFLPIEKYHGQTDGLIILNLIRAAFGVSVEEVSPKLKEIFDIMYQYFCRFPDSEISQSSVVIPGVLETFAKLTTDESRKGYFMCGLVTGNVEGIARKKMRATGIFQSNIFTHKADDQTWVGDDDASFLGGFGSDHCSCNIDDATMAYKDRGEQIAIAWRRAKSLLKENEEIVRVVHVGDAPQDILAAKWCAENNKFGQNVVTGCIGVATGCYSNEVLTSHAGNSVPGSWEPVVLTDGLADDRFIECCKIFSV
jgi:phosphoglycolate phosphatase-like HAD superfamily hydrolase